MKNLYLRERYLYTPLVISWSTADISFFTLYIVPLIITSSKPSTFISIGSLILSHANSSCSLAYVAAWTSSSIPIGIVIFRKQFGIQRDSGRLMHLVQTTLFPIYSLSGFFFHSLVYFSRVIPKMSNFFYQNGKIVLVGHDLKLKKSC